MAKHLRVIEVFIASPSDTRLQRDKIESLINQWNALEGERTSIRLEPRRWERHAPVGSGETPQEIIDRELLHRSDMMIAIFWTKFLSTTGQAISHTENEIRYFLDRKRPVILYVLETPVKPSEVNGDDLNKIKDYRRHLQDEGHTYALVDSTEDIEARFFRDIELNLRKITSEAKSAADKTERTEKRESANDTSGTEWFEHSIKGYFDEYLMRNGFSGLEYRRELTFFENCLLWEAKENDFTQVHSDQTKSAREAAFNAKYGNYNYAKDLRDRYKYWFKPVEFALDRFRNVGEVRVLGVASNDGTELAEIAAAYPQSRFKFSVVDLSIDAIARGQSKYPEFNFYRGNMESMPVRRDSYDLYLNLRSIHSSGVDIRQTLASCVRSLKPGGMAIISVSDGYIVEDERGTEREQRGMFDTRNKVFVADRPRAIAEKVFAKLLDFGFTDVEIHSGKTEIFLVSKKG
jgi:SAM-dependent methyltransferase